MHLLVIFKYLFLSSCHLKLLCCLVVVKHLIHELTVSGCIIFEWWQLLIQLPQHTACVFCFLDFQAEESQYLGVLLSLSLSEFFGNWIAVKFDLWLWLIGSYLNKAAHSIADTIDSSQIFAQDSVTQVLITTNNTPFLQNSGTDWLEQSAQMLWLTHFANHHEFVQRHL